MLQDQFVPPSGAFTRSVPVRFSHCDPAGIVYFPHYFDMFNGLIEDWYGQELAHDYAALVMGNRYGFPFVHIECDFKIPSRMGEVIDLTLLVERIGRSSLGIAIVCHRDGLERLRAHMVTAMMSLETRKPVPLPQALRDKIESYRARTSSESRPTFIIPGCRAAAHSVIPGLVPGTHCAANAGVSEEFRCASQTKFRRSE
jgi:4-hydroxybenzoyl-CoA thioesterase